MQDATDMLHDFQTLGPAGKNKRGCLATHLVVFGIGAVMGALVNQLMRQATPGTVPAKVLCNTPKFDNNLTVAKASSRVVLVRTF